MAPCQDPCRGYRGSGDITLYSRRGTKSGVSGWCMAKYLHVVQRKYTKLAMLHRGHTKSMVVVMFNPNGECCFCVFTDHSDVSKGVGRGVPGSCAPCTGDASGDGTSNVACVEDDSARGAGVLCPKGGVDARRFLCSASVSACAAYLYSLAG